MIEQSNLGFKRCFVKSQHPVPKITLSTCDPFAPSAVGEKDVVMHKDRINDTRCLSRQVAPHAFCKDILRPPMTAQLVQSRQPQTYQSPVNRTDFATALAKAIALFGAQGLRKSFNELERAIGL